MQKEIEEDDTDLHQDEVAPELEQHYCGNCMDCLGMSWHDFY